jgi:hypothetical protein
MSNKIKEIDLDIKNYSLNDLFNLFQIENSIIDLDQLKNAKKIVLQMHPDKSKLDAKYFLFFSSAYKKLYSIYEFQNKSEKKKLETNKLYKDEKEYYKDENKNILDNLFNSNTELKDPKKFNSWFNQEFEKHKIEDQNNNGYGDWLKSDEGIYETSSVNMSSMHEEFEKQKKKIQAISIYNGINDPFASTLGGTVLRNNTEDNYSSSLFNNNGLNFQDLRQAHVETIIPISNEDYKNIPKFKSTQEYRSFRDNQDIKPIKEEEALNKLKYGENKMNEESANLAYFYAKQSEDALKKSNDFWSGLKHIKG